MARLPKFLNLSAAGRVRVALPTAKLALVAFSCTLALVGMGVFAATLPSLTQDGAIVDAVAKTEGLHGEKDVEAAGEEAEDASDATDDQEGAEAQDAAAADGGEAGSAASAGGAGSASGAAATSAGQPSSGSASGTSSGANAGSGSSSSGASSAAATPSTPSSDGSSSSDNSSVPADDPFSATPSATDEQAFHAFLAGWYGRLGTCEAEAAAGNSSTCWQGYAAVRDYVRSNSSKWCRAQENLIGAYRCLAWYAESGDESNLAQYRSYKAAVSL